MHCSAMTIFQGHKFNFEQFFFRRYDRHALVEQSVVIFKKRYVTINSKLHIFFMPKNIEVRSSNSE